jgi:integrase
MYNTATRAQEVRAATVEQFDFSNEIGILTVDRAIKRNGELGLTKSNESRPVPLAPEVTEFIREKTAGMTKYILGDDHYVSKAGFEARYNHFFNRLNKHLESQGQKPIVKKSPHSLRRTRATFWHKNGMPLAMVSALLGHSSLEVTARYIGLSDTESLSEAIVKFGDSVREAKKRGELLPTILSTASPETPPETKKPLNCVILRN